MNPRQSSSAKRSVMYRLAMGWLQESLGEVGDGAAVWVLQSQQRPGGRRPSRAGGWEEGPQAER